MTDDTSPEERRLSKFSKVDRGAYTGQPRGEKESQPGSDNTLSSTLEQLIRQGTGAPLFGDEDAFQPPPPDVELPNEGLKIGETVSQKVIEELRAAQEQAWIPPDRESPLFSEPLSETDEADEDLAAGLTHHAVAGKGKYRTALAKGAELSKSAFEKGIRPAASAAGKFGVKYTVKGAKQTARVANAMRWRDWKRRYLKILLASHRRIFDRGTEKLLFVKTAVPQPGTVEPRQIKTFEYAGPIPRLTLDWALSGVPLDLKRYAFVDYRAGNGRTLLLAAKRNFEYAVGYAYDQESFEELEMNIAQYPRSYLGCRNLRPIRGDVEGVAIPQQPAVLFFPASLRSPHLEIIMSHASASLRLNPRPIYLIFENRGRKEKLEQDDLFEKAKLPFAKMLRLKLLSPSSTQVYRSIGAAGDA